MELLDTADVRFDFSQYTDVDNMIDVNGGWGPIVTAINASTIEFTTFGLHLADAVAISQCQLVIESIVSPAIIGSDGITVMSVIRLGVAVEIDTQFGPNVDMAVDGAGAYAPEISFAWQVSEISNDQYTSVLTDVAYGDIVLVANQTTEFNHGSSIGAFIQIQVFDVPNQEMRVRLAGPLGSYASNSVFLGDPTFVSNPGAIDTMYYNSSNVMDETFDEYVIWNRALSDVEIDSLVSHFTQNPEQGETPMPGPHDDQNIQHEVDVEQSVRDDLERTGQVGHDNPHIANASVAHALNSTFSDTEVEAALNALGTKLNSVIAALQANGILAAS